MIDLNTRLPVNCDNESPYSTNAKYEFGVKQCARMPCGEIEFLEDYDRSFSLRYADSQNNRPRLWMRLSIKDYFVNR